jgi:pimeloyl-ACP methyl ester carboxylesterase
MSKSLKQARALLTGFVLLTSASLSTGAVFAQTSRTVASDDPVSGPAAFDRRFQHKTATVNGIRMHYVVGGSGPVVVLLHGWPTTWAEWRPVMPALADAGYTVIAPDLRGLGRTEKTAGGYDSRNVAKDVSELVRSLGLRSVNLVGHDVGGGIAYAYAVQNSRDVRTLAILEGAPAGIQPPPKPGQTPPDPSGYWHLGFQGSASALAEQLTAGRERIYLQHFFRTYAAVPGAVSEREIDEYARAYSRPGAMRAGFEYYKAMKADGALNSANVGKKLPMPVLALGGETVMGSSVLDTMRVVAPQAEGGVIAGAGHWLMSEKPDEVAQRLVQFFAKHRLSANAAPGR